MKEFDVKQGSLEWFQLRRGIPTASAFDRIITPKKMNASAQQRAYIYELIAESRRLTAPDGLENYTSRHMQRGINTEPEARRFYEFRTNATVRQVGFCLGDDGRYGFSPDGLIDDTGDGPGGLELKCPDDKTHVAYLVEADEARAKGQVWMPDDYKPQVHCTLAISGFPWWDFMSYCVGWPPVVSRIRPDNFTLAVRVQMELFWTDFQAAKARVEKLEVGA